MSKRNRTNDQFVYFCPTCKVIVQEITWYQSKKHHVINDVVCDSQIHAYCTRCYKTRVWDSLSKHKCQLTPPQPIIIPYQHNQTGFVDDTQNNQSGNNNSIQNNENSSASQYNQVFDSVFCRNLKSSVITSGQYWTVSDERYKYNIHPLDPSDAQLLVQSLRIYVYQLQGSDNGDQNVGTVAQDIANNKDIPEYLKKLVLKIQLDPNNSGKERYVVDYQSLFSIYIAFSTNQDMVFTDVLCRRKYTRLWICFPTNEEGILKINPYRLTFFNSSQTITITRDQVHYVGHIRMEGDLGKLWTVVGYKDECGNPKTIYFIIYQELVRFPIFGGGTKLFEAIEKCFPDKRNEAFGPPKPHWIKTTLYFFLLGVGITLALILFIVIIEYMIPDHWKQDVDTFLQDFVVPKLITITYFGVCCLCIFYLTQAARQ